MTGFKSNWKINYSRFIFQSKCNVGYTFDLEKVTYAKVNLGSLFGTTFQMQYTKLIDILVPDKIFEKALP